MGVAGRSGEGRGVNKRATAQTLKRTASRSQQPVLPQRRPRGGTEDKEEGEEDEEEEELLPHALGGVAGGGVLGGGNVMTDDRRVECSNATRRRSTSGGLRPSVPLAACSLALLAFLSEASTAFQVRCVFIVL